MHPTNRIQRSFGNSELRGMDAKTRLKTLDRRLLHPSPQMRSQKSQPPTAEEFRNDEVFRNVSKLLGVTHVSKLSVSKCLFRHRHLLGRNHRVLSRCLDVAPAHSGMIFAHFAHPTPTPRPQLVHKMPTNENWNHIQNRALYHRISFYGPLLAAEWALCGRFEHACGPNAAGGSNPI